MRIGALFGLAEVVTLRVDRCCKGGGRSTASLLCQLGGILVVLLCYAGSAVSAAESKRVMVLHSFGREFKPWSEYAKTIRTELERQSPWPVDIIDHSLVSARSSDEDPEKPFVQYLQALFAKRPLDLIISIGAPAAAFVQRNRHELFVNTPMVFTAIDQRRVQYANLTGNDAVVAVRINYLAAMENILRVLPDTKSVTVVVGTSPIEQFWREAIARDIEPLSGRVAFSWSDRWTFGELLQNVAHLPAHSAIFWELMIVDAAGVVHEGDTPLAKVHAVANAPIFSYDESFFGREIVGGPLLMVADSSRQTAAVAVRILGGERAGDIKIPPVQFGPPMFDWRQMQRWGISARALPPGSEIHFRDPTLWDRYWLHILAVCAAFALQGALISWLIYEHWRRRVAEAESLQRLNDLARINRFATAGELSASIAHEIRQPLAAIAAAGYTGLNWLKHKTPNVEEARSALQAVVSESHRADHVIEGMRAVFRRETATRVEVDLNRLVQPVVLLTARAIKSNDIVLQTVLADEPIPFVMADPVQLQQVILNLIMNAVEAMAGSGEATKTLRIETGTDQAGRVFLSVEDSGPGFDAKVADNLFKPFVTTKPNGMGMGLSICKTIIGQHDGDLTASAAKPQGVKFHIVLPCAGA